MRFSFLIIFTLTFVSSICGQELVIGEITFSGNKRTKERVILRELTFQKNETIDTTEGLEVIREFNENRLLSIGLFNKVTLSFVPARSANTYDVHIAVNENWYLFPGVIFELADRNFNLWWKELNGDLSRVNYGLFLDMANLTGNRDKLTILGHLGYTRKLELRYSLPFVDKEGKWNMSFNAFYADVKELSYITRFNQTQFASFNDEIMLTRFRIGGDLGYRPSIFVNHGFRLEYHNNNINPYAASELNPNYFLDSRTQNQFFFFNYTYFLDQRAFKIFPESGNYLHINVKKEGFYVFNDYDNLSVAAEFEQYFNRDSKWIWNYRVKAKANLIRDKVAFANNTGLGYSQDVIRGYEVYVIDGTDYAYIKLGAHCKFFESTYNLSKYIPISQFNKIDLKLYGSVGFDMGYVNERDYIETNTFTNRMIYGFGPTFSVLLYNTYLFTLDYSINHEGKGGFFVNSRNSF